MNDSIIETVFIALFLLAVLAISIYALVLLIKMVYERLREIANPKYTPPLPKYYTISIEEDVKRNPFSSLKELWVPLISVFTMAIIPLMTTIFKRVNELNPDFIKGAFLAVKWAICIVVLSAIIRGIITIHQYSRYKSGHYDILEARISHYKHDDIEKYKRVHDLIQQGMTYTIMVEFPDDYIELKLPHAWHSIPTTKVIVYSCSFFLGFLICQFLGFIP